MIYQLDKNDYHKVKPLVRTKEEIDNVSLNGVINGTNLGNIYVDNVEHPQSALVDATGTTCYFIGDPENESFSNHLKDCIEIQLRASCEELGGTHFIAVVFSEAWEKVLERAIAHRDYEPDYESCFELDREQFEASKRDYASLSSAYTLKPIDKEIIENDPDDTILEGLEEFWESTDDFLAQGEGYCILQGNEIISYCYSCYVDGNSHEITVETCDEELQNKGLATLVSQAYIEHCLSKGINPKWSTFETNEASVKLADKLGYRYSYKLKTYEFEY
ncbi:GNAT family N-acetyltransferase [Paenibacillus arenosi]|uniref:GNAT family N-acetyltransferase n=1 Tax=Paenibacillus arenosi TaxID=2774142 RepID=A0ABR9AS21_9BACL|nr:GNAT family N-acetyltransferase [Paenibacillus arenosi]MBD8496922.1 GNAT family N-acetyltransferase [Paenibacillus arenosi]